MMKKQSNKNMVESPLKFRMKILNTELVGRENKMGMGAMKVFR